MDVAVLPSGVSLDMLREMGEWSALGFYEGLNLPYPRPHGRAFLRLYENMPVRVPQGGYLTPFEPMAFSRTRASHNAWSATAMVLNFHHHSGWTVNGEMLQQRKAEFPRCAAAIDAMVADLRGRLPHFGGYTHSNPDIRRVVSEGFDAIDRDLHEQLAACRAEATPDPAELNLLEALADYAAGVRTFHRRTVEALRQAAAEAAGERARKLGLLADALAEGFCKPSRTFLQGLLAVNFTWMLDGCDSIGRVDQALGGLWEEDRAAGRLDVDFARELIDELFAAFERLNGWNLQIGGWTPDGRDGTNELTYELIAACGRNHFRRPNVAFRVTTETPDDALVAALRALADGTGRPAIYNDDLYVRTLREMDLGLSDEDAREVGFGGCTETMIAGLSNVGSLEGYLNLAKQLELAIFDGRDPVTGKQEGPHTGRFEDFETFEQFLCAVRRQIGYMTDAFVAHSREQLAQRPGREDPKLYRTLFTRDCVRRRRSFEDGGARYNWAVASYHGIANLIDGLAAIRQCVFERSTGVSPSHAGPAGETPAARADRMSATRLRAALLVEALRANFEGFEPLRRELLSAPKFGNDDLAVDELGREIIDFAWQRLYEHQTPRGGRYLPSCILFVTYYGHGLATGATPDGRRAGEVLTDSVGPVQGRDQSGPTAMLRSVARLPLRLAAGTPILNIRLQKSMLATEPGLRKVAQLIRGFFATGGMQIQVSVVSRDEMLDAQKHPEKHADLIVRIGGYSEYFNTLDRPLQDSVIARTEYGQ